MVGRYTTKIDNIGKIDNKVITSFKKRWKCYTLNILSKACIKQLTKFENEKLTDVVKLKIEDSHKTIGKCNFKF